MIQSIIINKGQKPTRKQLEEVRNAAKYEIQFDEDSPQLSLETLKKFKRAAATEEKTYA